MYRYKYNKSYHHKSKRARRTTVLAVVFSVFVFGIAVYIVYDLLKENNKAEAPVSQETLSSVQSASINLFRTEYFQFQTDSSWKEVTSESKEKKYVYRSFNGPLVEHDITVEVNPQPEPLTMVRTTHIMPVQLEANGTLTVSNGAGEHCGKVVPKTSVRAPQQVTQRQVSFVCSVDAVLYQVRLGVVGGTTDLIMTRPDGSKATYRFTYRNLKFTPDDSMLRNIVSTFVTR